MAAFNQTRVTLKRLTVAQRLSEETLCYSADLYLDGRKAATVSNHGQGGQTEIRPCGEHNQNLRARDQLMAVLSQIAESSATEDAVRWGSGISDGKLIEGPEQLVDSIAHAMEEEKRAKQYQAKVARTEAKMVEKCRRAGFGCVRFDIESGNTFATSWATFTDGKLDDVVAKEIKRAKGAPVKHTVILPAAR